METDTYNKRLRDRTLTFMAASYTVAELSQLTGIPGGRLYKFVNGKFALKLDDAVNLLKLVDPRFTILTLP